jgi:site-specific DNA-cytosine methylase
LRVFSTFSGISAATAAWRELGWTMAGYAEINVNACAVLATRCGATGPKYLADPDHDAVSDASFALNWHIEKGRPKGTLPPRLLSYLKPGVEPSTLRPGDIRRLYDVDANKFAEMMFE